MFSLSRIQLILEEPEEKRESKKMHINYIIHFLFIFMKINADARKPNKATDCTHTEHPEREKLLFLFKSCKF